jgi:hypothetical protein
MFLTSRNIKKEDTPCKSYVADHLQKSLLVPHSTINDELGFCASRGIAADDYSFHEESTANDTHQGEFIQHATKTFLPSVKV